MTYTIRITHICTLSVVAALSSVTVNEVFAQIRPAITDTGDLSRNQRVEVLTKRAELGDAEAQLELGKINFIGTELPRDIAKAANWWAKAAEQGNADAQFELGLIYAVDTFSLKDLAKTLDWWQKAAGQGNVRAQSGLGAMFQSGTGVPKNLAKAAEWYRMAAVQGFVDAQHELGLMYWSGAGVSRNMTLAIEWLQKAALRGNARSQASLGVIYQTGDGVAADPVRAAEWHQKAAKQGDANSQSLLGEMYRTGEGVPLDQAKAAEWYQKAAAQGKPAAQYMLSLFYWLGSGVSVDRVLAYALANLASVEFKDAVALREDFARQLSPDERAEGQRLASRWQRGDVLMRDANASSSSKPSGERLPPSVTGVGKLSGEQESEILSGAIATVRKKAEAGDAGSQVQLGNAYDQGVGVSKDATKAVDWYRKAAAQGNIYAQHNLGSKYIKGEGVAKDLTKAVEWYQTAASNGNLGTQKLLGWMYYKGDFVPKDRVLAYAWANVAASGGDTSAVELRDLLEALLSELEKTEGQRISSNWQKGRILVREGSATKSALAVAASTGGLNKHRSGTMFIVSRMGHAITNQHVAGGCAEIRIQGREKRVALIAEDTVNDLALLQLQDVGKDSAAISADPNRLRQGEEIIAFGFPLNSVLSSGGNLTPGVVSALTGLGNNTNQIQITAPIQPGSSGSPVLNRKGEVIGVVSMKLSDSKMAQATGQIGQSLNFAVNGQTLKSFLDVNKVKYRTIGDSMREKSTADLADEARKWTLVVECWK
jgi:TPR repeat protein/S1-C subfamily serine protease